MKLFPAGETAGKKFASVCLLFQMLFLAAGAQDLSSPGAEERGPWEEAELESGASLTIRWRIAGSDDWEKTPAVATGREEVELALDSPEEAEVRWYQIVPDTSRFYKNANHPWEPEPYKWVGFGKIDYQRRELVEFRGMRKIRVSAPGTFSFEGQPRLYRADLGSFWISAEALSGGKRLRTRGLPDNNVRNLIPSVFRLSVRKDDGYLGSLTTYFNVPGVFGSIPYQCNNYIGVDCADVLVSAHRVWRNRPGDRDYNVSMLVSEWPEVARFEIEEGEPGRKVAWGEDVRPGDLIAVRYEGRTRFQHIGALYEDRDSSGSLNAEDLIIHAGPEALHLVKLEKGSFDGTVVILRPPK